MNTTTEIPNLDVLQIEDRLQNLSIQRVPKIGREKLRKTSIRRKTRRELKREIRDLKVKLRRIKSLDGFTFDEYVCIKENDIKEQKCESTDESNSNLTEKKQADEDDVPMQDLFIRS